MMCIVDCESEHCETLGFVKGSDPLKWNSPPHFHSNASVSYPIGLESIKFLLFDRQGLGSLDKFLVAAATFSCLEMISITNVLEFEDFDFHDHHTGREMQSVSRVCLYYYQTLRNIWPLFPNVRAVELDSDCCAQFPLMAASCPCLEELHVNFRTDGLVESVLLMPRLKHLHL